MTDPALLEAAREFFGCRFGSHSDPCIITHHGNYGYGCDALASWGSALVAGALLKAAHASCPCHDWPRTEDGHYHLNPNGARIVCGAQAIESLRSPSGGGK